MTADKKKALQEALASLEKIYKRSDLVVKCSEYEFEHTERIEMKYPQVNYVLGGGIPRGRIIEIYGAESSGKSLFSAQAVAQFQKKGLTACWVDLERSLDPGFYALHGMDMDNLLISTPNSAEECMDTVIALAEHGAADIIVVDSVAALLTEEEIGKTSSEATMGIVARLLSKTLKKLVPAAANSGCTVIFINQIRDRVGALFGNPETTPGGKALRFYSSLRLQLNKVSGAAATYLNEFDEPIGHLVKVKTVKNKTAPPFKQAEFPIYYDGRNQSLQESIDSLLDLAEKLEIVSKPSARTFMFTSSTGEVIEGMKTKFAEKLVDSPEVLKEFYKLISNKAKTQVTKFTQPTPEVKKIVKQEKQATLFVSDKNE